MTLIDTDTSPGPSPRVRGSHREADGEVPGTGSIPACAGKPLCPSISLMTPRVHPRVCGEAVSNCSAMICCAGPSPRVRGSLVCNPHRQQNPRSIPACAGKPTRPCSTDPRLRVHPRVCGEASMVIPIPSRIRGPSPRVRGSRPAAPDPEPCPGSIPACAGKPRPSSPAAERRRVHPRVCGEACCVRPEQTASSGPSPRVRGSPRPGCPGRHRPRSIPAWCGEAGNPDASMSGRSGPSPRVRGSLDCLPANQTPSGSIPACAGKPRLPARQSDSIRVHPRVCGEAIRFRGRAVTATGPSPRVRGSRIPPTPHRRRAGSIPACAGKPLDTGSRSSTARVHPRVCGEARKSPVSIRSDRGPSPRVRGSRCVMVTGDAYAGSIPACAGKPARGAQGVGQGGVHPRVCGEATATTWPAAPV